MKRLSTLFLLIGLFWFSFSELSFGQDNSFIESLDFRARQQRWNEVLAEVGSLGADSGIHQIVFALNLWGFKTCWSCEGHLGQKGQSASPFVMLGSDDPKVDLLYDQLFKVREQKSEFEAARQLNHPDYVTLLELERSLDAEVAQLELAHFSGLQKLLDEFYQARQSRSDVTLVISRGSGKDISLVNAGSLSKWTWTPEYQAQVLSQYQAEMKEFADFLTRRYLKE